MANKINYQKLMEDLIKENCMDNNCTPRLLLHSCCGPCSTYCIQTLSEYFKVTVFYYNPNIYPPEEYHMRAQEQKRFIDEFPVKNQVDFVEGVYDTKRFYDMARGMEAVPEGGERCFKCYRLRLEESAQYAREHGFDFFTTTLSISPLKNAEKLNIKSPRRYQSSMICTGSTTAAVYFLRSSVTERLQHVGENVVA